MESRIKRAVLLLFAMMVLFILSLLMGIGFQVVAHKLIGG